MPSTHHRHPDPGGRRSKPFRPASSRDLGLLAAVGVAVCCGLPLLIGAGALAAVGGAIGSPAVIAAGAALAVGTVGSPVVGAWAARPAARRPLPAPSAAGTGWVPTARSDESGRPWLTNVAALARR